MIYNFQHKETGEITEHEMMLCERETFINDHPELEQILITPLRIGDSVRLGYTTPPNSFLDKLDHIKSKVPKNNMESKYWGKNIREI